MLIKRAMKKDSNRKNKTKKERVITIKRKIDR